MVKTEKSQLKVNISGGIIEFIVDRPDALNSISPDFAKSLLDNLKKIKSRKIVDKNFVFVFCAKGILTPGGRKVAMAGGDLRELAKLNSKLEVKKYAKTMQQACDTLRSLPIPTLCWFDGEVLGGAAEFACSFDLRFGSKSCCFAFKQLEIGLSAGFGGTEHLVRLVGTGWAQKLFFRPVQLGAKESVQIGLLTEIVDEKKNLKNIFEDIRRWDPQSFLLQKRLIENSISAQKSLKSFAELWRNPLHEQVLSKYEKRRS